MKRVRMHELVDEVKDSYFEKKQYATFLSLSNLSPEQLLKFILCTKAECLKRSGS